MALDPRFDELDERLFGGDKNAGRTFEEAVARLFHLLGFAVDHLGGSKALSDAVDFVAVHEPSTHCYAIEVTSSSLDTKGKLGKLVARASALEFQLQPLTVTPVIVSKLERSYLSDADIAAAGKDRVAVLALEDVRELRGLIGQAQAVEKALLVLVACLPKPFDCLS